MKLSYLWKGLPGHPIHPPLTDATIGTYTFATVAAVLSKVGVAEHSAARAWWLALIIGLVVVNLWQPGVGMNVNAADLDAYKKVIAINLVGTFRCIAHSAAGMTMSTCSASTCGSVRRLPCSSALTPLAIAITSWPGRRSGARRSPAHRTPRELTPLTMMSAPASADSRASRR